MRISDWSSDVCSSDLFGSGANKAIVLNNDRISLQRLKHTADADTAGQMHILADLGAASNRHPGIHHGALIDNSAHVDDAGHQHDIPGYMRSMPCNGPRHSAETGAAALRLAPALTFRGHLVPPMHAAGAAGNSRVVIEAQGPQY